MRRPSHWQIHFAILVMSALASCARPQTPRTPRLLLIGIDGATWEVIDPMRARGALPNLDRLVREGTRAHLHSPEPLLSPLLWTTIATGRPALEHGITWFFSRDDHGGMIPVSGARRQVPALWDVASANGRKTAVVGWWATWPAEKIHGVMVSDRVAAHGFGVGAERPTTALIYPPKRVTELLAQMPDPLRFAPPELQAYLPPRAAESEVARGAEDTDRVLGPLDLLRAAALEVETYRRISLQLLREEDCELLCVYFEGIDTASHVFMAAAPAAAPHIDPAFAAAYGDVVEDFYRYQDRILGELLAAAGPETGVVVVSDHGFRTGAKRLPPAPEGWRLDQAHRDHLPLGILILHGPMFRRGVRLESARLEQVAPTALYALDLPVEKRLAANLLKQAFTEEFVAAHPLRTVERYPPRRPPPIPASAQRASGAEVARLRALGYIGGGSDLLLEEQLNRAMLLEHAGRLEEAAQLLESIADRHPDAAKSTLALASVRLAQGRLGEARAALEISREKQSLAADALALDGRLLMAEGKPSEAERAFRAALAADPNLASARVALGDLLHRQGRDQEADRELRLALELDDTLADGWYNLGVVQEALGSSSDAAASYQRALGLQPNHVFALGNLGVLLEKSGAPAEAEARLRRALALAPRDPVANINLGLLLLRSGRPKEAIALLKTGAELRPDLPALRRALERAEALAASGSD
ncbi:MAG TPA: alkaline phosphatase family protein [Acidobacteriota bacterium]